MPSPWKREEGRLHIFEEVGKEKKRGGKRGKKEEYYGL